MAGRPTVIDETTIAKLEYGFTHSLTDNEACLYAEISPASLYRYIQDNPAFGERKEILKKQPNIKAKFNWIKKIEEEDYVSSKEWLERKAKDEFSTKQEVKSDTTSQVTISTSRLEALEEIIGSD